MNTRIKKILMSIIGVMLAGISVGFLKRAALGVDPFQAFMSGLDSVAPLSFGTLYAIVGLTLLLFSFATDKHYIGLGTFVTLLLQGYVIDFATNIMFIVFPEVNMPVRIIFFLIGILLLCFATAIYFTADLGVSAYDAVSLIITNTFKKGKFKYNRILTDCVCVIAGSVMFLMSGGKLINLTEIVGIGTIVTAFFMGPLVDYFKTYVVEPFCNLKSNK